MVRSRGVTRAVVMRGLDIYENQVAPQLSDADEGRFVAIDVDTGEWDIGDTESVGEEFRERLPDAEIFLWRHPDIPRGHIRGFSQGTMKRLGIPSGILDEASE